MVPLAQLDRASDFGSEGCRVQILPGPPTTLSFRGYGLLKLAHLLGQRVGRAHGPSLKDSTLLHDECLMVHVALDLARRLQTNVQSAYRAHYLAEDDDIFRRDVAGHPCLLADYQPNASDVAFYIAINAQFAL